MPDASEGVVFDPSLLRADSVSLLEALFEADVSIFATGGMKDVLSDPYWLADLLRLWDFPPREVKAVTRFLPGSEIVSKMHEEKRSKLSDALTDEIRYQISQCVTARRHLVNFFSDQLSLAIDSNPILASHASPWRTVEFLKRMGLRVKKDAGKYSHEKVRKLRLKDFRKELLEFLAGSALLYILAGPAGLLGQLGLEAIHVVVIDP